MSVDITSDTSITLCEILPIDVSIEGRQTKVLTRLWRRPALQYF